MVNSFFKNIGIWLVIGFVIVVLFNFMGNQSAVDRAITFSDFLNQVEKGNINEVIIRGDEIHGINQESGTFQTTVPEYPQLIDFLEKHGIGITVESPAKGNIFFAILNSWLPMLLIIGIWIIFMRQLQGGSNKTLGFGKIRARTTEGHENEITFKDVAGIDEAREELSEIVEFLSDPQKFEKLGGEIPRGVLLVGNPGTGKTLLAKAIAGEAEVPFFSISGSDFVEMFVGVGASRVRDLFEQGKKAAPCIIFIDEIDAVGRSRGAGLGGGNDEREQTLNQLLVEMDGFDTNNGVIIVAATNRPDVLDPALLRPGRFDRHINVPLPDINGREAILKVHTQPIQLGEEVDLRVIARGTPGFTGADLANLANEAALWAARKDKSVVELSDFEYAKDKVLMGTERKSLLISDEEKETTAYHEAGHALIAASIPEVDPVHKVTIIPRGRALGLTQLLPLEDRHSYTKKGLLGHIAMTMGGRAAEHLIFNRFTTGASDDLRKATDLARKMICQWGMNEKLGPLACADNGDQTFLGRDLLMHKSVSDETAQIVDLEVKELITTCYTRAKEILEMHRQALEYLAKLLIEKETVDGEEVAQAIKKFSPMIN
ncbi:MAG: ATP-dependent zinc metalloprotease FtsH [SAR324 cluster bacterium]|nr:ATP-dependent zinc metalloprotease FtsH [SAR324 cluster bacterium]